MVDVEKIKEKTMHDNAFCQLLEMELLDAKEGYAYGRIPVKKEITNIYGSVHGGASYALADTIGGIAAITYGYYVVTIDGKINYLLPMKDTQYLYCEAKVVRQGSSIGVYDILLTNDKQQLVAKADFTYFRLQKTVE